MFFQDLKPFCFSGVMRRLTGRYHFIKLDLGVSGSVTDFIFLPAD